MYPTTREFVQALDRAGELTRLGEQVSPILEITRQADAASKSPAPFLPSKRTRETDPRFHHLGGKALLFENVAGSDIPVVINQFGSYRRVEMALGCNDGGAVPSAHALGALARDQSITSSSTYLTTVHAIAPGLTPGGLEALADRLGKLIKPEPPPTLIAKLKKLPELLELAKMPPKRVKSGICQQTVITGNDVDLTRLPIIRCWPLDGDLAAVGSPANANDHLPNLGRGTEWEKNQRGRYITLAGIHTIHRDDLDHPSPPSRNIGMYRVQLLGKKHMAMHWHMHHDGARHWRSWRAKGEKMPVAIALGGESVLPYAATAPMPPGISELLLAGFLNRGAIPMVRCKTVPIDVPANSEIVIEGWVDTEPSVLEGPFGDHTGFYSLPDRYPLLEVTAITHRRDPIYPTTVVGLPPQEDYFLGKATERLFLPLLKTIVHDIIDYDLPMFGAFHNCAFIKIRKEYPLQGRRIMHSIWGAGQMAWTKMIVVVDDDVDVHDVNAVMRAVAERCDPQRDICTVEGPLDILDHAAPYLGAGGKIGFDATRKIEGEQGAVGLLPLRGRNVHRAAMNAEGAEGGTASQHPSPALSHPAIRTHSRPAELSDAWLLISVRQGADLDDLANHIRTLADPPRFALLLGHEVDPANLDESFFHWCAHFDPIRDRIGGASTDATLIFDATPKHAGLSRNGLPCRDWPPILTLSRSG